MKNMENKQSDNTFYYVLAVASIGLGFILLHIFNSI